MVQFYKKTAFLLILSNSLLAQIPQPALIGYLHNWQSQDAPYIALDKIDDRYNIINVGFAVPRGDSIVFSPDQTSPDTFLSQIKMQQNKGKKVLISIGGGTDPVYINSYRDRDNFVKSIGQIVDYYGFDGIDIDLEGSSLLISGGTIASPVDSSVIYLTEAIQQIMANYYVSFGKNMMLTMAPETAQVQGGQSKYTGVWGAYLPVIEALRDSIDILHVQVYNSGSMYGIDRDIYEQGTADFIISQTEAVIQGFETEGGRYNGLPASKVAIGLPACENAASNGYTNPAIVKSAIQYLMGQGPQPGKYKLRQPGGYPDLRGMMTWSINWDATPTCGESYSYATTFDNIFGDPGKILANTGSNTKFSVYPNPVSETLFINSEDEIDSREMIFVSDMKGRIINSKLISEGNELDFSRYSTGMYLVRIGGNTVRVVKE